MKSLHLRFNGLLCLIFTLASPAKAAPTKISGMYVNTFGDSTHQPLIFVHGGPGYNSWDFELTTASALAQAGFFVVVYDERGQGRSEPAAESEFSYKQYADDLNTIIKTLGIKNPVLLAHSHGGPISIKFDQMYPGVAKKIVLIGAPINFWGSISSMLTNCSRYFEQSANEVKLTELAQVYYQLFLNPSLEAENLPWAVIGAFSLAGQCGLYQPRQLTSEAQALMGLLRSNPIKDAISAQNFAVAGFIKNDNYIHLNEVDYVSTNSSRFCGLYGDEDGLFTPLELQVIKNSMKPMDNSPVPFKVIKGASHAVYIFKQAEFIESLTTTCAIAP
jgi:proline iminopeptidase